MSGNKSLRRNGGVLADTASAVASMLLFVLFAICMLMAVAVAADTYGRIKVSYQESLGAATSIRYIANKIRAAEEVTLIDGGAAITNGSMVSIIYCDGGLYEKTAALGEELTLSGGDKICDIDSMSISEHDGLYEITVQSGGEVSDVLVRKE